MKSSANIATLEAKRIAKRLVNHWKHKFEVAETDAQFSMDHLNRMAQQEFQANWSHTG